MNEQAKDYIFIQIAMANDKIINAKINHNDKTTESILDWIKAMLHFKNYLSHYITVWVIGHFLHSHIK